MFAEERQQKIAQLVSNHGRASVNVLAKRFSITTETVRRDLAALEAIGTVRRVHGGAVAADRFSTTEESVTARTVQRRDQKLRIARAALTLVPLSPAGSILLDAGTTTEVLADLLAHQHPTSGSSTAARSNGTEKTTVPNMPGPDLVVITNSLPIATKLFNVPGIALHLLGGRVRGLTEAAVGQVTAEAAGRLRPDVVFLGANGIHSSFGLSTPDPEEAAVKAAFVHSARRIVVLADSSKLDAETLVQFAPLKDLDTLITDTEPGPELAAALADAGVDVVVA